MIPNIKPSKLYSAKDEVLPQSAAAAATLTSGWIDAASMKWLKILALVGAGAGTVAIKVEQATTAAGAGVKDLYTAEQVGITALATAAKRAQADVALDANLDVNNAFRYVRISLTVTGGAGTLVSASAEVGPVPYLD